MKNKICKNCKHWGEERLKIGGGQSEKFRLCLIQSTDVCKVFAYGDSPCDAKINAFEEVEHE